jgi:DNA-directed RNA polymerase specialized sigma24 family protein
LLGVPPLRREITLRHWAGEDDGLIAERLGISLSEVVWHCGMTNGHIDAIWEAKKRREEDHRYLRVAEQIVEEATVH